MNTMYFFSIYNNTPVGIAEIKILNNVFLGTFNLNSGKTMIKLSSKYKKFAESVAIPTPTSPIFGIRTTLRITPIIPEINLIINSICVLFARWYCNVV